MRVPKLRWWCILFLITAVCLAGIAEQKDSSPAPAHARAVSPALSSADLSAVAPGYGGMLFTQIPVAVVSHAGPAAEDGGATSAVIAPGTLRRQFGEGGRLMLLSRNGALRTLTPEFASAADPAVSFDGTHILFAGKKSAADRWDIFEMKRDGSEMRQITRNMGNCRTPMYQSSIFYLDDSAPAHQVTFASDLAGELSEDGVTPAMNLYSLRFDGSRLRRLTFGVSSSFDPALMPDGRIVFSNGQAGSLASDINGRVALFAVNLDGTDYAAFSGLQGRRIKHMAAVTAQRLVAFIESDSTLWDGAGGLATINLKRNLHSYRPISTPEGGLYATPSPLPDGELLVSRRPSSGPGTHAIYRLDPATGRQRLVFGDSAYHSLQAVALMARSEGDGHASVVEDDQHWSKLYALSVFQSDLDRATWGPGIAQRIRVIEGVPRKATPGGDSIDPVPAHVPLAPQPAGGSPALLRRMLGTVALEKDGSFHLQVPPNTPIQLQLLDANGMALRTSAWIWTKNKENRGCIGCHENNELTPENVFPQALGHPAADLTLAPERRRTVDFRHDVRPILLAKCATAACHGDATERPFSGDPRAAYDRLLAAHGAERDYVDPGRARTSRLVWQLLGRNTARPWDKVSPATIHHMTPPGSPPLTEDEIGTIVEWIDLGAQFSALPDGEPAGPSSPGGLR